MPPRLKPISSTPGVIAWRCDCGAYSIEDRLPFVADELATHLKETGHPLGEYFYGAPDQRTRVVVERHDDGSLDHRIDWS